MDIGKEQPARIYEPVEDPFHREVPTPAPEPRETPAPEREREREPEKVPA
jgi:hypothetical protein